MKGSPDKNGLSKPLLNNTNNNSPYKNNNPPNPKSIQKKEGCCTKFYNSISSIGAKKPEDIAIKPSRFHTISFIKSLGLLLILLTMGGEMAMAVLSGSVVLIYDSVFNFLYLVNIGLAIAIIATKKGNNKKILASIFERAEVVGKLSESFLIILISIF